MNFFEFATLYLMCVIFSYVKYFLVSQIHEQRQLELVTHSVNIGALLHFQCIANVFKMHYKPKLQVKGNQASSLRTHAHSETNCSAILL